MAGRVNGLAWVHERRLRREMRSKRRQKRAIRFLCRYASFEMAMAEARRIADELSLAMEKRFLVLLTGYSDNTTP